MPGATELRLRLTTSLAAELALGRQPRRQRRVFDCRLDRRRQRVRRRVAGNGARDHDRDAAPRIAGESRTAAARRCADRRSLRPRARRCDRPRGRDPARRGVVVDDDRVSAHARPSIVRKGSIAVDGISLTVAGVDDRPLRRPDHPVYVGAHEPADAERGRPSESRMRHSRQIRVPRARGRRAAGRLGGILIMAKHARKT